MINYKTNSGWFRDMFHLTTSYVMVRVLKSTTLMGVYAALVWYTVDVLGVAGELPLDVSVFSVLGVILSIFLVFRTNTAYDRWWEARIHWGALVNNCRNMAIYVDTMFPAPDPETRRYFAKHISNFCLALAEHLRHGTKLELLCHLTEEEKAFYGSKQHIPNFIALRIFARVAQAHRDGEINEGDYINIKAQHQSLLDILGACERIKKTPIPFSYAVYLKVFISAYGVLMPWALAQTFHLATVPVVMLVFFALVGIELMGEEIEDPFGRDCNDLPTGDIAQAISNNVFEILTGETRTEPRKPLEPYQKIF